MANIKAKLSNLLSKEKKVRVENWFSRIRREEFELFEKYLKLHEKKISLVKEVIPEWNNAQISRLRVIIEHILFYNEELNGLAQKILELARNDEKLFLFIIREKLNQMEYPSDVLEAGPSIIDKNKVAQYVKDLKRYFDHLFDFLRALLELITLQTKTIKEKGEAASAILAKDLIERQFFYHLLVNEAKLDDMIKNQFIRLMRETNKFLGFVKKYKRPRPEIVSKGLVFYDIKNVKMRNLRFLTFEKFYELYQKSFREEQQDPESFFKRFLSYHDLKVDIKEGATRTHLVVGIAEGKVVALTYFSVMFIKKRKICFGVGWYRVVAEEYRRKGISEAMHQNTLKTMQKDARMFKVDNIDAMFAELNDPVKMIEQGIRQEPTDLDPFVTVEIMREMKFLKMRYEHEQPPIAGKGRVTYSMMIIKPFNTNWRVHNGIPLKDMEKIWRYYVDYGYEPGPATERVYEDVIKNMRLPKSQVNGYVMFEPLPDYRERI